jgi:hypothetical protein
MFAAIALGAAGIMRIFNNVDLPLSRMPRRTSKV